MQSVKETDTHVVVGFTSKAGKSFEVGYPKTSGYSKENIIEKITANAATEVEGADSAAAFCELRWVAGGESFTSRAAMDIGIIGGHVSKDNGIIYTYRLHFANSSGWSFTFIDGENDTYDCGTSFNGNHYIDFNSSEPTIHGVR